MKLISMTDFVLEQEKYWNYETTGLENSIRKYKDCVLQINNYAKFLKQPLKLGMFVPCDDKGNLLEELSSQDFRTKFNLDYYTDAWQNIYKNYCIKHKEAKAKVLFEGFDLSSAKFHCDRKDRTIEYFTSFEVELTPNAINHIFG